MYMYMYVVKNTNIMKFRKIALGKKPHKLTIVVGVCGFWYKYMYLYMYAYITSFTPDWGISQHIPAGLAWIL